MENSREIENLIDRKIAEAKLEVTEKRLSHVLWIIGLVGIIIPLSLAFYNALNLSRFQDSVSLEIKDIKSDWNDYQKISSGWKDKEEQRIDNEILLMQNDFKELAGRQLRKPNILCLSGSTMLYGQTLIIKENNGRAYFTIKNTGDGKASNLKLMLYANLSDTLQIHSKLRLEDWVANTDFETGYNLSFEYKSIINLNPKDFKTIMISAFGRQEFVADAMVKISAEELQEPIFYPIKIRFIPSKE